MVEDARWQKQRMLSNGVLTLDAEDLRRLLPLSKSRILIDQVISLQPGRMAVAQKAVSGGDSQRAGNQVDFVFPSTTAMSALEQLSCVVLLSAALPEKDIASAWKSDTGMMLPRVVEIENLEVDTEMVVPGILHLRVTLIREVDAETCLFEGGVSVAGVDFIRARWLMGEIPQR